MDISDFMALLPALTFLAGVVITLFAAHILDLPVAPKRKNKDKTIGMLVVNHAEEPGQNVYVSFYEDPSIIEDRSTVIFDTLVLEGDDDEPRQGYKGRKGAS